MKTSLNPSAIYLLTSFQSPMNIIRDKFKTNNDFSVVPKCFVFVELGRLAIFFRELGSTRKYFKGAGEQAKLLEKGRLGRGDRILWKLGKSSLVRAAAS